MAHDAPPLISSFIMVIALCNGNCMYCAHKACVVNIVSVQLVVYVVLISKKFEHMQVRNAATTYRADLQSFAYFHR